MQDLDKFKNEMNLSGQNVYVGHRYKPKMFGEWDNTKIYEPLSIVQYQGNSFTSRQYVPVGIEITNEEYWAVTGNYNAQVEQYRQEVRNMQDEVSSKADKLFVDDALNNINNELNLLTTSLSNFSRDVDDVDDTGKIKKALKHANDNLNTLVIDESIEVSESITIPSNIKKIIGVNKPVITIKTDGNSNGLVITGNRDLDIFGLIFDGENITRNIIMIENSKNIKIIGSEVRNAFSDLFGSNGVYIINSENVTIEGNYIHDIKSFENGIVGDTLGAARGVYMVDVINTVVKLNTFEDIGGFEDGDGVHVQSQIENNSTIIEHNTFLKVTKRAIKLQAKHNIVRDNYIESSYVGANDSPLAGISDYGADNVIINNTIKFLRGSTGIRLANEVKNSVVKNNVISIDEIGAYRLETTRTSQSSCILLDMVDNVKIHENELKTKGRKIYSTSKNNDVEIKDNIFHEGVSNYIEVRDFEGLTISDNTFKTDVDVIPYQIIQITNVDTCLLTNNTFYTATNYFRLFGTVKSVVILPNIFIENKPSNRYRLTDITSGLDDVKIVGDYETGTSTIPAGKSTFTFNHSLGRLPKSVIITPKSLTGVEYTANGTTISTVLMNLSEVSSDDFEFYWRVE